MPHKFRDIFQKTYVVILMSNWENILKNSDDDPLKDLRNTMRGFLEDTRGATLDDFVLRLGYQIEELEELYQTYEDAKKTDAEYRNFSKFFDLPNQPLGQLGVLIKQMKKWKQEIERMVQV